MRELPTTVSRASTLGPNRDGAGVTANQENAEWSRSQYRDLCGKCGARRIDNQIGIEEMPEAYVAKLVEVFREVRRLLHPTGTCWINLGDSFRDKQLLGIPWRVAFALQTDGWILRSDIIWAKPNPMPESVTDRPTKAHEYIFLLSKSAQYFYDAEAIREGGSGRSAGNRNYKYTSDDPLFRTKQGITSVADVEWHTRNRRSVWTVTTKPYAGAHFAVFPEALVEPCILAGTSAHGCCAKCGAPWARVVTKELVKQPNGLGNGTITKDLQTHKRGSTSTFATGMSNVNTTVGWAPSCACDADVVPCTVLDPFAGSGTTGAVALKHGRKYIGCELNPDYIELAHDRIRRSQPMLLEVTP